MIKDFLNLYDQQLLYYWNEFNESLLVQEHAALNNANASLYETSEPEWTKHTKYLNETALDWLQHQRCSFGAYLADSEDPSLDYTYYLDALWNLTSVTYYYRLGAYTGVGWTVPCSDYVNTVIENLSEWDKAGANAAMADDGSVSYFSGLRKPVSLNPMVPKPN